MSNDNVERRLSTDWDIAIDIAFMYMYVAARAVLF